MRWEWELTDLAGVTVGLVRPRQAVVTRNLNAASTVQVDTDDAPSFTTAALVKGWRAPAGGGARVLRAAGKIRTAMQLAAASDALDNLNIQAVDGFGVLADRLLDTAYSYAGATPRFIVLDQVFHQNVRAQTGLRVAEGVGGPVRDRNYEPGKNIAELVQQLAEVDDGFYYRVDPVDAGATFSEIVLLYPTPGVASGASFEFGPGTAANLSSVQVDVRPPVNSTMAFGAGTGDAQMLATASDPASIAAYGLVEASASFPDVVVQETLDQHARDMLHPSERRTFKVEVAASVDNGELATPAPWDDFDVGDTVRLAIRTNALSYTGRALVKSFTVTVSADGTERLTALDFQEDS